MQYKKRLLLFAVYFRSDNSCPPEQELKGTNRIDLRFDGVVVLYITFLFAFLVLFFWFCFLFS